LVSSKKQNETSGNKTNNNNNAILTIRIDNNLDEILTSISEEKRLPKSTIIRDYLEMVRYFSIDHNSIKSLNENDLIILKKNYFFSLIDQFDELRQIDLGRELGQFINDISRIQGKIDDMEFKLDLCEKYGFFPKFIDKENYILFSNKFGPKRFVESFVWYLLTKGEEGDFDRSFIESELSKSTKLENRYKNIIQPVQRDASHYSFEFAKLPEKEKK